MKVASIKTRIYLGAFVLILTAVAGLCIVLAGDNVSLFRSTRNYQARFENTAGLIVGAPVRMGGVEVGRVANISINSEGESLSIVAQLKIDSPFFELIRSDASVGLETQGLLGDKFVALQAGMAVDPLDDKTMIATRKAGGMGEALEKSGAILDGVKSVTGKIDAFATGLPDQALMKSMVNDFAGSAAALRVLIGRLSSDQALVGLLGDREAKASLQRSLAQLESAMIHTASIAEKVDKGQGTLGALVNDRSLYEDLREMLGHRDRGKGARRVFIEAASESGMPAPAKTP